MFTNCHILAPTDFSDCSMKAWEYARAIAIRYESVVHFVHAVEPVYPMGGREEEEWQASEQMAMMDEAAEVAAKTRIDELILMARGNRVQAEGHIVRGRPVDEVCRMAGELAVELIVMATHGRTGLNHMMFGSVAEHVVRHASAPVLTVKQDGEDFIGSSGESVEIRHVLFPTDFSVAAESALPYVQSLCRQFDARLTLLHVCEIPVTMPDPSPDMSMTLTVDLTECARDGLARIAAGLADIEVTAHVVSGAPCREICRAVDTSKPDLIVLPAHGHSGFVHALFGSVAEKVVRLAHCPVLTLKPGFKPAGSLL